MKNSIEFRIIIAALFIGLFYRVLRSVVFDSYIWILITPAICLYYVYFSRGRYIKKNTLDKIFSYFIVNGFIMTLLGLFISLNKLSIITLFVHIYAPASIYFVAKSYFSQNKESLKDYFNIILVVAMILVIDILVENYLYLNHGLAERIPWIADGMQQSYAWGAIIWDSAKGMHDSPTRFLSILASGKSAGLLVAGLFCLILPLSIEKSIFYNRGGFSRLLHHKYIKYLLLGGLIQVSFLLPSVANTVSLGLASAIIIMKSSRKIYGLYILILGLGLGYLAFWDSIQSLVHQRSNIINSYGQNAIDFIFQIKPLVEYYTSTNILAYIFSASVIPTYAPASSLTELDIFLLPIKYGIGWTIIVLSGGYFLLKYSYRLIRFKNSNAKIIGLSTLGYCIVILTNIHYPKFHIHGNYELMMVVAGALSAFYDKHYSDQKNIRVLA